ncbi:MAG: hypothetical protein V1725_00405 [archaeon]
MQLIIDTTKDSPEQLRKAIAFLQELVGEQPAIEPVPLLKELAQQVKQELPKTKNGKKAPDDEDEDVEFKIVEYT